MHLGATPISGGPSASARASTDLGRPPQIERKRADLGSSPLESADSGGRAETGSSIEIRADLGQSPLYDHIMNDVLYHVVNFRVTRGLLR
jgi:hypothetical protein